jgi:hypothetical protein
MFMRKAVRMRKVRAFAIGFSILLMSCAGSDRYNKPRSEPDGFGGIKWQAEISTLKDMERVTQGKSSDADVAWYMRKGDTLAIGKAKLEKIFYSFWMGNFESVWIDFKGDENFEALKKELFQRYGKAFESEELVKKMGKGVEREPSAIAHSEQFYAWWGKNADISLSYSKGRHTGTLCINSKTMTDERRTYEKQKEKERRSKEEGS